MAKLRGLTIALCILFIALSSSAEPTQDAQNPVEDPLDMQQIHHRLSVQYFNQVWTIIDKQKRSAEETEDMILLAYASLWHWRQRRDVRPLNLSIGYWQVSRVHALAGQYEMAKLFADKCLQVSTQGELTPFYMGYAYEALTRAEILSQDSDAAKAYLMKAEQQLGKVKDQEEM
ncbi:MAG: hypothetical protein V3S89_12650 [Desulfobacterales bacterium]